MMGAPAPGRAHLWRRALAFLATAVVLAAVILGVAAIGSRKPASDGVRDRPTTTSEADLALERARAALASGDSTRAIEVLERALAVNPGDGRLERALTEARARAGASSSQVVTRSGVPTAGAAAATDPRYLRAVERIEVLLPATVEGYALGTPVSGDGDAAVSGSPIDPSAGVSRALWSVHDRKSAAGAKRFLKDVTERLYSRDAATVVIDGAPGRFGTDGKRFAAVVYVRGRYVFEVVLTASSGAPAALKGAAEVAAAAFPESW